jgi:hypothetical protein
MTNENQPNIPEVLCPETLAAMSRCDLEWLILDQEKTIERLEQNLFDCESDASW